MAEEIEERAEKREDLTWDEVLGAKRWTKRQAEWVIRQWQSSGHSVRRFAEEHGLDAQRVYLWRRQLGVQSSRKADNEEKRTSAKMVEVKLVQSVRRPIEIT